MTSACTYVDDLTIGDPRLLSTLCLLYDKVFLPHPYDHDASFEAAFSISFENERYREVERRWYSEWKTRNGALFGVGALEVLASPVSISQMPQNVEDLICSQLGGGRKRLATSDVLQGRTAIALHALFAKPPAPEFATARPASTVGLTTVLAESVVEQRAPFLTSLSPDQLCQIREQVAPFREGFRLYLQSLADDVEHRIDADLTAPEAARLTFERKIEPELLEYFRRELPTRISWWASVVSAMASGVGNVLAIAAKPWSIDGYPKLAEGMANFAVKLSDHRAAELSNNHQAYQFIGHVERASAATN